MTLEGTNAYLFGSGPCVVIDPGSDDPGHLDAIRAAAAERGGIGLVLLTHSHGDHTAGAEELGAEVKLPGGGEEHFGLRVLLPLVGQYAERRNRAGQVGVAVGVSPLRVQPPEHGDGLGERRPGGRVVSLLAVDCT